MAASTLNLAAFEGRVSQLLDDTGNAIFSALLVDECIRQALGDIGRAMGSELTINGLEPLVGDVLACLPISTQDLPLAEEQVEIYRINLTRRGVDAAGFDLQQLI